MTINEKIKLIRKSKGMSQAELAYKIECAIEEIKNFETNDTTINGYIMLQILNTFNMSIEEFKSFII